MSDKPKWRVPWLLVGAVLLGIAIWPWLPKNGVSDRCHPEGLPTVKVVALDVCVNPSEWSWYMTPKATMQSFGAGRDKVYFDSIGFPQAFAPEELRQSIFEGAHQYATNYEDLAVIDESEVTLGGRTWHRLELASETSQFVYYSYSAEGFGTAELFFLGFKENVKRRDELAAPILASVRFKNAAS